MTDNLQIRGSAPEDISLIENLYRDAFPDEDLMPLVKNLLREKQAPLSMVGTIGSSLVAHIIFTICHVEGNNQKMALLGPLCVASAWQRQGLGSAIVRTGLTKLKLLHINCVYVLGDPAYYSRHGFTREERVFPPYSLPHEWRGAWQSIRLIEDKISPPKGKLDVPSSWLQPSFWLP